MLSGIYKLVFDNEKVLEIAGYEVANKKKAQQAL